jgi:hypothetical protein
MQLRIGSGDDSDVEQRPLVESDRGTVLVAIRDDHGAPALTPMRLIVEVEEGGATSPLSAMGVDGASARYRPALRRRWHLAPCAVVARALDPSSDQVEATARRELLSRGEHTCARVSRGVFYFVAAYLCLLVQEIETVRGAIGWATALPLVGAAIVAFFGAARMKLATWLSRPWIAASVAFTTLLLALLARRGVTLVVNQSLEEVKTGSTRVAPGKRSVVLSVDLEPSQCDASKEPPTLPDEKRCVTFPEDVGLLDRVSELLGLRRVVVGCAPQAIPPAKRDAWRKTGECAPKDGLLVEDADLRLLQNTTDVIPPERLSVQLRKGADIHLQRPDAASRWKLHFSSEAPPSAQSPAQQRGAELLLVMQGTDAWREIATRIRGSAAKALTPVAHREKGVGLLEARVMMDTMPLGRLSVPLVGADPVASCWLADMGSRVSAFVLGTDARAAVRWRSEASELASSVPLCWTRSERPEHGELHLDAHWAAGSDWTIELPRILVPKSLIVWDPAERHWGELACPAASGSAETSNDARWSIGPLLVRNPRAELKLLKAGRAAPDAKFREPKEVANTWEFGSGREPGSWFWMCWPSDVGPPAALGTTSLWSLKRIGARVYEAQAGQRPCTLDVHGTDQAPDRACTPMSDERRDSWFKVYGKRRPDCAPPRSRICE